MTPSFFVVRVWLPISKEAGTEFPIREENIETGPDVFRLPVQFHRFCSLEARLRFHALRKPPRLTRQVQDSFLMAAHQPNRKAVGQHLLDRPAFRTGAK